MSRQSGAPPAADLGSLTSLNQRPQIRVLIGT